MKNNERLNLCGFFLSTLLFEFESLKSVMFVMGYGYGIFENLNIVLFALEVEDKVIHFMCYVVW